MRYGKKLEDTSTKRKQEGLPFSAGRFSSIEELLAYFVKLGTLYKDKKNHAYKSQQYSNASFVFYMHRKTIFMPYEDEELIVAGEKLGVDTVRIYFEAGLEYVNIVIDDSMIKYINILPTSVTFYLKNGKGPITVWVS